MKGNAKDRLSKSSVIAVSDHNTRGFADTRLVPRLGYYRDRFFARTNRYKLGSDVHRVLLTSVGLPECKASELQLKTCSASNMSTLIKYTDCDGQFGSP